VVRAICDIQSCGFLDLRRQSGYKYLQHFKFMHTFYGNALEVCDYLDILDY